MKVVLVFILFSLTTVPSPSGWEIFERVRFSEKYFEEFDEYYLAPFFDSKIKALVDTEVTLKGYYLPMDLDNPNVIVLSKYPYSMCFFLRGGRTRVGSGSLFFREETSIQIRSDHNRKREAET